MHNNNFSASLLQEKKNSVTETRVYERATRSATFMHMPNIAKINYLQFITCVKEVVYCEQYERKCNERNKLDVYYLGGRSDAYRIVRETTQPTKTYLHFCFLLIFHTSAKLTGV